MGCTLWILEPPNKQTKRKILESEHFLGSFQNLRAEVDVWEDSREDSAGTSHSERGCLSPLEAAAEGRDQSWPWIRGFGRGVYTQHLEASKKAEIRSQFHTRTQYWDFFISFHKNSKRLHLILFTLLLTIKNNTNKEWAMALAGVLSG